MKPFPRMTRPWLVAYLALWTFALAVRVIGLSNPHALIFDETYYAKDAWALLQSGYERSWTDKANDLWLKGDMTGLQATASYVVHPPLGKWMIGLGLLVFGPDSALGWRIMPALAGTATVAVLSLTARRLFRSQVWGLAAGFLLAIDGQHLVMSRTALLDIFLTLFVVMGFAALVKDRDVADDAARATDGALPAVARFRLWRIAAGVCLGLALGVKWSALSFIAVFALLSWAWDAQRRRRAGDKEWALTTLLKDAPRAFWQTVVVSVPVYMLTWLGWFTTSGGYNRSWAESNPHPSWAPGWLASWWNYHETAYRFHNGLSAEHPYKANAYTWIFQGRPTSFYYQESTLGQSGCGTAKCSAAITDLGNPIIWWAGAIALVIAFGAWIIRRDRAAGAAFLGVFAGYAPWFLFPNRTMFTFYSVSFEPWVILCLVYSLALVYSTAQRRAASAKETEASAETSAQTATEAPSEATARALRGPGGSFAPRLAGWGIAAFFVAAALVSVFFWPVWTGQTIDYSEWRMRMWLPTWI